VIVGTVDDGDLECFWAANRDGSASGCLGMDNAFNEGPWPHISGSGSGNRFRMEPDSDVPRPAVMSSINTTCTALSATGNDEDAQVHCWDRRRPKGDQLYVVSGATDVGSVVQVSDTRLCFMALVDATKGTEIACADFTDESAMPPTAAILHDSNTGANSGARRCNDGDIAAFGTGLVCWWAATIWSESQSSCKASAPHCHHFDSS